MDSYFFRIQGCYSSAGKAGTKGAGGLRKWGGSEIMRKKILSIQ